MATDPERRLPGRERETWGLTSYQKAAARKVIIGIDSYSPATSISLVPRIPYEVHAVKLSEAYVLNSGIREANRRRMGQMYLDIKTTESPSQMYDLLRMVTHDGWRPKYVATHISAGRKALEAASRALRDTDHEDTRLVLTSVPSTMSEDESRELYGCAPSEAVAKHARIAQDCGFTAIAAAGVDLEGVPGDMTKIASGIRFPCESKGDHVRTMTPAEAIKVADYIIVGSRVVASNNPQEAFVAVLTNIASA